MKIRYRFEDFKVEEILKKGTWGKWGEWWVYKVTKEGKDTFELCWDLAKLFGVPRECVVSAGLKDKYAVTTQFVAVKTRKKRMPEEIEGKGFEGKLVGRMPRPLTAKDILKNRFIITLRDVHPDEVKEYEERLRYAKLYGYPNYFDEQRFGSARHFADPNPKELKDFIGKRIINRDWEGALKIYFQAISDYDRSRVKKFKKIMRRHWGNWATCLLHAQNEQDKRILRYLVKFPSNFREALEMIENRMLRLYLEVYQSYIFNEVLAKVVERTFPQTYKFPYWVGYFVFPLRPTESGVRRIEELEIPYPHPDAKIPREIEKEYLEVLEAEGVSLKDFRSGLRSADFQKGKRKAWVFPENLEWDVKWDEAHAGAKKIMLMFELPPGSFATMLIKYITPLRPISATEKKPIPPETTSG